MDEVDTVDETRRRRPLSARVFVVYVAILLIAQEVFFRVLFPVPEVANFNRINYTPLQVAEGGSERSYLSRASYTIGSEPDGVSFEHQLNLYGFRDREWRLHTDLPRVLFVGDSFVEGFMAESDETIPSAFSAAAANDGIDVDVMNMGIGAAGLEQYCKLIRDAVPIFWPDTVMLVLFTNDVPAGPMSPEWFQDALEARPTRSYWPRGLYTAMLAVQGHAIPFAWHRRPFPFFSAAPSAANPWSNAKDWDFVDEALASSMKRGAFNPFVVDELVWTQGFLRNEMAVRPHLTAISEYIGEYDAELMVVYLPDRHRVSDRYRGNAMKFSRAPEADTFTTAAFGGHSEQLEAIASAMKIPFLDLTQPILEREARGIPCYYDFDSHLRGDAYSVMGQQLYAWWVEYAGLN